MGEIRVKIKLTNHTDLVKLSSGLIAESEVRSIEVEGLIDTGASMLIIPRSVVDKLGLEIEDDVWVRLANNGRKRLPRAGVVELELMGCKDVFPCLVAPDGAELLVGQIVLETLDLIAECTEGKAQPAHEEGIVYSAMYTMEQPPS